MQLRVWLERATGPSCRATSPTAERTTRHEMVTVFVRSTRRQVAAENGQVGRSTQVFTASFRISCCPHRPTGEVSKKPLRNVERWGTLPPFPSQTYEKSPPTSRHRAVRFCRLYQPSCPGHGLHLPRPVERRRRTSHGHLRF